MSRTPATIANRTRAASIITAVAAMTAAPVVANSSAPDSGVRGRVVVGPSCGAESNPPYPGCEDRPYRTRVRVKNAKTKKVVARIDTNSSGRFAIKLRPGNYLLAPRGGQQSFPRCFTTEVSVTADAFARVDLGCDSGIG